MNFIDKGRIDMVSEYKFNPEKISFEQYNAYYLMYFIAPDKQGTKVAVATNISGQINVWLYLLDKRYRRLTPFTDRRAFPSAWNNTGDKLLFLSDYKGDELRQIYMYSFDNEWVLPIVYEEGITHFISKEPWSPDEAKITFTANREQKNILDIYMKDLINGKISKLCDGPIGAYVNVYWNQITDSIIVENFADPDTIELYLVNIKKKQLERLTPPIDETTFSYKAQYKQGFLMTTNYEREFQVLAYYDLEKKKFNIIKEHNWDIEAAAYSDGHILYSVNDDGYSKLYLYNLKTGKEKLLDIKDCVIWELFGTNKGRFFYSCTSYKHPLEVFYIDIHNGIHANQVTDMVYSHISEKYITKPEIIKYNTFDNKKISAVLYKAKNNKKSPILILLHGGPEGQSRPGYDPFVQYITHRGISVIEPNFRGSSGYGRTFQRLIRKDWAGGELEDVEYLVKYLETQDWADTTRLAVMGGSFGGFLTLACVTMLPEYWRCGIDFFGPSNLLTLIETSPPFWRGMVLKLIGDPDNEKERKLIEERSPVNHVDNVKCPMLIVQGARDYRVKKSESDQIVEKLKAKGIDVKYIVFEDEGHGFTKEKNRKIAYKESIKFLLDHLK